MKSTPFSLDIIGREGAWYVRLAPAANRESALANFAGQEVFGRHVEWSPEADYLSVQVVGDLAQACATATHLSLLEAQWSPYRN